jgi:hypothetical protein
VTRARGARRAQAAVYREREHAWHNGTVAAYLGNRGPDPAQHRYRVAFAATSAPRGGERRRAEEVLLPSVDVAVTAAPEHLSRLRRLPAWTGPTPRPSHSDAPPPAPDSPVADVAGGRGGRRRQLVKGGGRRDVDDDDAADAANTADAAQPATAAPDAVRRKSGDRAVPTRAGPAGAAIGNKNGAVDGGSAAGDGGDQVAATERADKMDKIEKTDMAEAEAEAEAEDSDDDEQVPAPLEYPTRISMLAGRTHVGCGCVRGEGRCTAPMCTHSRGVRVRAAGVYRRRWSAVHAGETEGRDA